ncbi:MAG: metallophosphoesterase [Pseudomonadota bacterium]
MKIRILSDLHIEHNMPEDVPACGADLTILAGDIANGRDGIDWAARVFDGPVLYVPGNHEYYESTFDAVSRQMTDAAGESGNVTLLSEGIAEFEDADGQRVRVIGTTWWTDYCLYGVDRVDEAMQACSRVMLDHRLIATADADGQHRPFTPADALARHRAATAWLADALAQPFDGKTVVVTHHGPDLGSLDARYAHDIVSAGFISRRPDLVAQADLWIHGHTHTSFDYWIDSSRVVCNPRGYISRRSGEPENPAFDWSKAVTL